MDAIHVMKPGAHIDANGSAVSFSAADLQRTAAAYDPAKHEAPIVVGHPMTDAPAYGWIERLEARPEGLFAVPKQINTEFSDLVRQGAFKKVSGSFYRPDAKNHPVPGTWYLRHIGFLGAQPPAVKGLQAVNLNETGDGFSNFEEDVLALRVAQFEERERASRLLENAAFVERLVTKGSFPVGLKGELAAFMDTLSETEIVNFSDSEGEPASENQRQHLRNILAKLPPMVAIGELTVGEFSEAAEFSAPRHTKVSPEGLEIHNAAIAYQKQNKVSYQQAVKAVAR